MSKNVIDPLGILCEPKLVFIPPDDAVAPTFDYWCRVPPEDVLKDSRKLNLWLALAGKELSEYLRLQLLQCRGKPFDDAQTVFPREKSPPINEVPPSREDVLIDLGRALERAEQKVAMANVLVRRALTEL